MGGDDRMGLLECASGVSVWRGYDYYKEKKVVAIEEIEANIFSAKVSGNSSQPYSVELHIDHPRKSKCNCPHADGSELFASTLLQHISPHFRMKNSPIKYVTVSGT